MKRIRILALLLAIFTVLPLAVACADAGTTTTATKPAATETKPATDPSTSATLYVAVTGSDDADGTKDKPLATLAGALGKIKTLDKKFTDVEINIGSGVYSVRETIRFTNENCDGRKVTVRGENGAIISGGVAVPTADFALADDKLSERFPESSRENIVSVDLKKYEVDLEAVLSLDPEYRMITLNGETIRPSRFPDYGYLNVKSNLDSTTRGEPIDVEIPKTGIRQIEKWESLDGVRIFLYARQLYFAHRRDLLGYDADKKTISFKAIDSEGLTVKSRFYFFNIPEEMTMAGEYYLSDDGILYIYKTDDFDGGEVRIATINDDIINIDGVDNLTFDNITLQDGNGTCLSGTANYLTVKNSTIRNANNAIITESGHDIKIHANTFYNLLSHGVDLKNDELGLDSMNNEITYNELYNYAINEAMHLIGLGVRGAGNLIAHNEVHDANWQAYYMQGFNNVLEYNEAYNLLSYNDDVGVYHFGGPGYYYGNILRYNYFHNIGGTSAQGSVANGIYFDDGLMDQRAYGNVLVDIQGRGFLIGGGREHHVTGNLIINARDGILYDQRLYDAIWGEFWYREMDIRSVAKKVASNEPWTTEKFLEMFPWMKKVQLDGEKADPEDPYWFGAPAFSELKDNVVVISNPELIKQYEEANDPAWRWTVKDAVRKFSDIENPTYIISTEDHSSLEAIAKLDLPDFIDIPFDKIGRNPKVAD